MEQAVRWEQRFANFDKAFALLSSAIDENGLSPIDIIKEGIIHRFEFTHELACKVMKDFLSGQGIQGIIGSKDATRYAFQNGLITEGQIWMDMIASRNKTGHTYHQDILNSEFSQIVTRYYPLLAHFHQKMQAYL